MKKIILIMALAILSTIPINSSFGSSAYALSSWDNIAATTDELITTDHYGLTSASEDVSFSYGDFIAAHCSSMINSSFVNASNSSSGVISIQQNGTDATLAWSASGGSAQFVTIGSTSYISLSHVDYKITMGITGNNSYFCGNDNYQEDNVLIAASATPGSAPFYFISYGIVYPSGYAGVAFDNTSTGRSDPITGDVVCAYDTGLIASIRVVPVSGLAGYATISSNSSTSGVSYSYHLSQPSNYKLEVNCGGTLNYDTPLVNGTLNNFACASGGPTSCVSD